MADSSPLPAGRFTDPAFAEAEQRNLWSRQWLVVGREDEVAEVGQYFTWERTAVPLIVIRGIGGAVRGFYNSCRHRGAPVVREARGRNRALRCQYHSWTYDTLGRLVSVPDERDFVDLRLEERALVPVRAAVAGGWVLANTGGKAEPLVTGARSALEEGTIAGGRMLLTRSQPAKANWKVVVAELSEAARAFAGADATLTRVFPNGLLATTPEFTVLLHAWPSEVEQCELQATLLVPDWDEEESPAESPEWRARSALLNAAIEGAAARAEEAASGPGDEHSDRAFHRMLDAAIGPEHVPAGLLTPAQ